MKRGFTFKDYQEKLKRITEERKEQLKNRQARRKKNTEKYLSIKSDEVLEKERLKIEKYRYELEKSLAKDVNRKKDFKNNQYDSNGIYRDPDVEVKSFYYYCSEDEFTNMYLDNLGVAKKYWKFIKVIINILDKGGGFTIKEHEDYLKENGFSTRYCYETLSKLRTEYRYKIPIVYKYNMDSWKFNKEILFRKEDKEIRIYILKEENNKE